MGVYIEGMEMPATTTNIEIIFRNNEKVLNRKRMFSDTSAIKISTPHGRLIDADSVMQGIQKCRAFHGDYLIILQDIFDGEPTIIPASGGQK